MAKLLFYHFWVTNSRLKNKKVLFPATSSKLKYKKLDFELLTESRVTNSVTNSMAELLFYHFGVTSPKLKNKKILLWVTNCKLKYKQFHFKLLTRS